MCGSKRIKVVFQLWSSNLVFFFIGLRQLQLFGCACWKRNMVEVRKIFSPGSRQRGPNLFRLTTREIIFHILTFLSNLSLLDTKVIGWEKENISYIYKQIQIRDITSLSHLIVLKPCIFYPPYAYLVTFRTTIFSCFVPKYFTGFLYNNQLYL